MKNIKKVGVLTAMFAGVSSVALAANPIAVQNSLADWVSLVAEILSFVCLAIFAIYTGRYISTSKNASSEGEGVKTTEGVKNGIMTALIGIAICQAVVIIAQALFVK